MNPLHERHARARFPNNLTPEGQIILGIPPVLAIAYIVLLLSQAVVTQPPSVEASDEPIPAHTANMGTRILQSGVRVHEGEIILDPRVCLRYSKEPLEDGRNIIALNPSYYRHPRIVTNAIIEQGGSATPGIPSEPYAVFQIKRIDDQIVTANANLGEQTRTAVKRKPQDPIGADIAEEDGQRFFKTKDDNRGDYGRRIPYTSTTRGDPQPPNIPTLDCMPPPKRG